MLTGPHLSADECYDLLHEAGWSIGETATETAGIRLWIVYGHRANQKIMGRSLTQTEARRAALMAAGSVTSSVE